jgi:hypothetical protein
MRLLQDESAVVNVWITVVILLFTIVTVYVLTYGVVCVTLFNAAISMAPLNADAGYFNVLNLIRTVYNIFPWIMCFGVILWGYLNSQRKEYERGY